jgi:hypothetical protein
MKTCTVNDNVESDQSPKQDVLARDFGTKRFG